MPVRTRTNRVSPKADEIQAPAVKSVMSARLAEFIIGDQAYCVLPSISKNSRQLQKLEIVGELRINGKSYVIVPTERHCEGNLDEDPRRSVNMLTKREFQIVMLVAEGHVNKQIADRLNISEWTVSTHLRRIFAKLGVDSRAAMVYQCSNLIGHVCDALRSLQLRT